MARTLINVPPKAKRGQVIEIKTLISHVMETGYRRNEVGAMVPRDIINTFVCTYNGEEVFRAGLHPAIAANPFISFFATATESGKFEFKWTDRWRSVKSSAQGRIDGDQPTASLLGCAITQLDHAADFASGIEDHVPGQLGDLAGPQSGFDRQQHDQLVPDGVAGVAGKDEEAIQLMIRKCLRLLARHLNPRLETFLREYNLASRKAIFVTCRVSASRRAISGQNVRKLRAWASRLA